MKTNRLEAFVLATKRNESKRTAIIMKDGIRIQVLITKCITSFPQLSISLSCLVLLIFLYVIWIIIYKRLDPRAYRQIFMLQVCAICINLWKWKCNKIMYNIRYFKSMYDLTWNQCNMHLTCVVDFYLSSKLDDSIISMIYFLFGNETI